MGQSQESKKQDTNLVMIKRDIAEAGYGKCDPGRRNPEREYSVWTLKTTCVVHSLVESLTEQPQEGAES
jgi:hypothetical protein